MGLPVVFDRAHLLLRPVHEFQPAKDGSASISVQLRTDWKVGDSIVFHKLE